MAIAQGEPRHRIAANARRNRKTSQKSITRLQRTRCICTEQRQTTTFRLNEKEDIDGALSERELDPAHSRIIKHMTGYVNSYSVSRYRFDF